MSFKYGIIFCCLFAGMVVSTFPSCLVIDNKFTAIAPGTWRAILQVEPKEIVLAKDGKPDKKLVEMPLDEVTAGELPFTFEVIYSDENTFYIDIINGSERIKVDNIQFGHDRKSGKDTIRINMPVYDSYIRADYEEGVMVGEYVDLVRKNYSIPFIARHGKNYRFTLLKKKPMLNITGKWETTFGLNEDEPYKAIGEFTQNGNHLTGTFMTETGDYRFLEGTVQNDKVYLSCFDGAHAFLFEAKILQDSTMIGTFRSGSHYQNTWKAKMNPDAELTDPEKLTYLKEGYDKINFSFENPEGKTISLDNEKYKNKIKIVQIFGTWCPNCRDETIFLNNYLKENNLEEELKIVALAFEKYRDKAKANQSIQRYIRDFGLTYEMVVAGYYNKKEAAEVLPMLNHVLSYPTMIFIDKNDQVRKIHTGFNGPATSQYAAFVEEFDQYVKALIAEPAS